MQMGSNIKYFFTFKRKFCCFFFFTILISDKIDLKLKSIIRDKEGHYILTKGSIQEEDVTIVNIELDMTEATQQQQQQQHRSVSIHKTNTNRHKRRN